MVNIYQCACLSPTPGMPGAPPPPTTSPPTTASPLALVSGCRTGPPSCTDWLSLSHLNIHIEVWQHINVSARGALLSQEANTLSR
jgi:hypothetical protein